MSDRGLYCGELNDRELCDFCGEILASACWMTMRKGYIYCCPRCGIETLPKFMVDSLIEVVNTKEDFHLLFSEKIKKTIDYVVDLLIPYRKKRLIDIKVGKLYTIDKKEFHKFLLSKLHIDDYLNQNPKIREQIKECEKL